MRDLSQIPEQPFELWPAGAAGPPRGTTPEDRPRLTPYFLTGATPHPCIIVCPGGGYGGRAAHEGEPIARWCNKLGIAAVVLDYRVAPYRHPIPLGDAQRAIRTVRANADAWNVNPNRIAILGFSAGGHLAASAATIFDAGDSESADAIERVSSRPDAAILCYPVITFGDEFRHDGSMQNLLGPEPTVDQREYMSLENRVTPQTPPTFIWHTADDEPVPVENSLLFAIALRRNRVPFSLHVFPHGRHGLALTEDAPLWAPICANWLDALP